MGKMNRLQERQREEVISRMLQDGYDLKEIAEHPQVSMYSHNLRRKIKNMKERGVLGTASYFIDNSELKTLEEELKRIREEIKTYSEELKQPKLSNNRRDNISRHLSSLRRTQKQYIQEKRRLISAPTQKFDPVVKRQKTWADVEADLIRGVMRHNKCSRAKANDIVDEAAKNMAQLLDRLRLETMVEDEPFKS